MLMLLRVLEYYDGVIVLMADRVKTTDVVVILRIHLAILHEGLRPKKSRLRIPFLDIKWYALVYLHLCAQDKPKWRY